MQNFVFILICELFKHPCVLIFFALAVLSSIYYKKFRGFMGEFWVKVELNKLPKDKYVVLNDIMINSTKGSYQIDHIVISKFGIFVIEMKNCFGIIIGDEYKDKWIQCLGKSKYYFSNPIYQNYGHIKALEELLQLDNKIFISIICISNQAKVNVKAKNVTQLDLLDNLIQSYKIEILNEDLESIKRKIQLSNVSNLKARSKHVQNIKINLKENEEKMRNGMCPRCGSQLIERSGKYGRFIGCSNFPKCKFTNKIEK